MLSHSLNIDKLGHHLYKSIINSVPNTNVNIAYILNKQGSEPSFIKEWLVEVLVKVLSHHK